jgi:hypothetical protein
MTSGRWRFAAAALAWWAGLLAAFIPLPLAAPWAPDQVLALDGSRFAPVFGQARSDAGGLQVLAMDIDQGALQVHPLPSIDAATFDTLRYRFESMPQTLELTLVFRRADSADQLQVLTIPTIGHAVGTLDLGAVPEWRGRIVEIGFAQYPGAQSVPPTSAFSPFTLVDAALWSPSWRGALAARWRDWFGPRSWALMSLSALGPDSAVPAGPSLVTLTFLGLAGTVVLGYLLLGWRGPRLGRVALVLALLAWVLLDLRWLHGLHARQSVTRAAYAGLPAAERQRLLPDQELFDSAQMVRRVLAAGSGHRRVFVDAGSDFQRARLLFHLLPLNVAPVNMVGYGTPAQREGAVAVLYALDQPAFDPVASTLGLADGAAPVEVLFDLGALRVYRFQGPAP